MTTAKRAKTSGEHDAVQTFRAKLDSISETTLPLAKELNERIERARRTNDPMCTTGPHLPVPFPASRLRDPRREPDDDDDDDESTDPIVIDISDLDELD